MTRETEVRILRKFIGDGDIYLPCPKCKRCGKVNRVFRSKEDIFKEFTLKQTEEFWEKYTPICFTCVQTELLLPSED